MVCKGITLSFNPWKSLKFLSMCYFWSQLRKQPLKFHLLGEWTEIGRKPHCWKEIGDFQIICSKVGGFRPFNYLLGVRCYLLSLKCKWLVLNKLCNFTAYKLFVSTNKQLTDPMDSMANPLLSSYSAGEGWFLKKVNMLVH